MRLRGKVLTAVVAVAGLAVGVAGSAFADNVVGDGTVDGTVVAGASENQPISMGTSVCSGATRSVEVAIKKTGSGDPPLTPGSVHDVTIIHTVGAAGGLSVAYPNGNTINLPDNWNTAPQQGGVPNDTVSDEVVPVITITRTTTGPFSLTVDFGSSTNGVGGHVRFTLTGTIVNCAPANTAPTLSLPADIGPLEGNTQGGRVVTYTATATDLESGALTPTCVPASGSLFALGTTTVNCSVTDGELSDSGSFTVTIVDTTPPTWNCSAADSDWHATNQTSNCTASDVVGSATPATFPLSTTVAEGVEDGNASTGTQQVCDGSLNCTTAGPVTGWKIDRKAPTAITWDPGAISGSHYFGFVPAQPTCSATDGGSGLASCAVTGYSVAVGDHTLTATATDNVGNWSSTTSDYTVSAWTLGGFFNPVDMGGVVNTVRGGSTVPLKFEVFAGPTELTATSVVDTFRVGTVPCDTLAGTPTDDIEQYTSGQTVLRYDTTGGQFIQNWQTPRTTNTCYRVVLTTDDGSSLTALFRTR